MIVAFGDSLTAGFGAEPGNSYPDFLQKDLDRAGLHWHVINAGVSGDTPTIYGQTTGYGYGRTPGRESERSDGLQLPLTAFQPLVVRHR